MKNITKSNIHTILLNDFYIESEGNFLEPFLKRETILSSIASFLKEKGINCQINQSLALFVEYKNTLFEVLTNKWYCRIDWFRVIKGDLSDAPEELIKLKDEYNNKVRGESF